MFAEDLWLAELGHLASSRVLGRAGKSRVRMIVYWTWGYGRCRPPRCCVYAVVGLKD